MTAMNDAASNAEALGSEPTPVSWLEPSQGHVVAIVGPRTLKVEIDGATYAAKLATTGPYTSAVGDRVVVVRSRRDAWVIGVLGPLREARTSDGVGSTIDRDVLRVRDSGGAVLFEHDARTGISTVSGREVHITADELDLRARTISIEGSDEVRIARGEDALVMDERRTELSAARFRATLNEARFSIKDAVFGAGRIETAVHRARHVVDTTEITAGRIIERAKDVFRETEGVSQTRAGRIRMIANGVFSVLSERATIKADGDMALTAEKIELG